MDIPLNEMEWQDLLEQMSTIGIQGPPLRRLSAAYLPQIAAPGMKNRRSLRKCAKTPSNTEIVEDSI